MMVGVMRQEDLSGSALRGKLRLWLTRPSGPETQSTTVSGSGRALPLVGPCPLFPLGRRVGVRKVIACPLARGSASLVALCLFFCHSKEWKGVFPQPVMRPSPGLSSDGSSPLCSSDQHMCVFSSFLLQVKGLPLSPEGGGSRAHVTLDPGPA